MRRASNFKGFRSLFSQLSLALPLFFCSNLHAASDVNELEMRISKLEKQLANQETPNEQMFYLNKDKTLKIGGWVQAGHRGSDKADISKNEFYIRRARLDVKGTVEDEWAYRLFMAFEGSEAKLQEGWLQYNHCDAMKLRLGQIKPPYSLETSYSARWTPLIERSLGATNISTYEELGFMVFGNLFNKRAYYALSAYNGNGKNTSESNSNKEFSARLRVSPFPQGQNCMGESLKIGASFGKGRVDGALSSVSNKTASRVAFVTFPSGVTQNGTILKYGADLEWTYEQVKLMAEYIALERNHVLTGAIDNSLTSRSWYFAGTYLLTGEKAVSNKAVTPLEPFSHETGGKGAWELAYRYEELRTSAQAFNDGLIAGARSVKGTTLGLNWYPNTQVRAAVNLVRTNFGENLTFGTLVRDYENAAIVQVQFVF
ncbi:hypothetical protein SCG7109_BD_00040 [Chlamydiales bacterium SCGC AG-110-M15]|nr:hypothetical protein SCG7109_BD_00040 [Chlamydiales bacterium SCGC AG-110-M15]